MSPVARTIQSVTGEVRLSTNRASSRSMIENVAPDQPSVGNGCSGRMWRSKRRSSSGSVSRGGAAIRSGRSAPSAPPSRYTTWESGQLRVSTTTSGSVAEAFASTWISPAGM